MHYLSLAGSRGVIARTYMCVCVCVCVCMRERVCGRLCACVCVCVPVTGPAASSVSNISEIASLSRRLTTFLANYSMILGEYSVHTHTHTHTHWPSE